MFRFWPVLLSFWSGCALTLLLMLSPPTAAQIYKWVDENGKVYFGDKPRQQNARNAEKITLKTTPSGWQPLTIKVLYQGSLAQQPQHHLDQPRIQRDVNRVYRFYDQVLYFDFYKKLPVKIHVLSNEAEYHQYVQQISGERPLNSLGVYLPASHEIAVFIHPESHGGVSSTYRTIKHEASHAILHSLAERMPNWLNEGMAEQMETLEQQQGQFVIARHNANRRQVLRRREQLLAADTFIEIDSRSWRHGLNNGRPNQAMAGQLVYLALSKSYGRSFITRLLQDYKRGVNLRSFYLLNQHYIGGVSAFKLHWQQWLSEDMARPAQIILP